MPTPSAGFEGHHCDLMRKCRTAAQKRERRFGTSIMLAPLLVQQKFAQKKHNKIRGIYLIHDSAPGTILAFLTYAQRR